MADSSVTLKLTSTEYRFLRNEIEIHADNLRRAASQNGMKTTNPPSLKERADMRKREASLRAILKGI